MRNLFTDERLEQRHVLHARAQLRAQSLGRVRFGFGQQVELVAALAADVAHAVVALVVFVGVPLFAVVQRERGELADAGGDGVVRGGALAVSGGVRETVGARQRRWERAGALAAAGVHHVRVRPRTRQRQVREQNVLR